ncbi:MAG: hypothetical protein ACOC2F_02760 [Bacteroidota bacterium]
MITKPLLVRFRNSELLQFLYDVTNICKKNNATLQTINGHEPYRQLGVSPVRG